MKSFVFWLALSLLPAIALATAGPSLAANTFSCAWNGSVGCRVLNNGCSAIDGEHVDPNFCMQWKIPSECSGKTSNCVQGSMPPVTCESANGICRTGCLSGEYPDNLTPCSDTTKTCCKGVITPASSHTTPFCNNDVNQGVSTAIGCLMAQDPKQLVSQLLGWGVGIGGGIAFLMIIFAGFQMTTASGDPKRVKAAQELITSAIAGLILIVLSVVLLNFIGVNILGLNNLGFSL